MKVGDLVQYKSEYVPKPSPVVIIVAVGYGGRYTDTEQSPALHPDIWILAADGEKERWNVRYVEVVSEAG
jgi:hypothetical protein